MSPIAIRPERCDNNNNNNNNNRNRYKKHKACKKQDRQKINVISMVSRQMIGFDKSVINHLKYQ